MNNSAKFLGACLKQKVEVKTLQLPPNWQDFLNQLSRIDALVDQIESIDSAKAVQAVVNEITARMKFLDKMAKGENFDQAPIKTPPPPYVPKKKRPLWVYLVGFLLLCGFCAFSTNVLFGNGNVVMPTPEPTQQLEQNLGGVPIDLSAANLSSQPTSQSCAHALTYPGYTATGEQFYDWAYKQLGVTKDQADDKSDPYVIAYMRDVYNTGIQQQFVDNSEAVISFTITFCK